MYWTMVLEEVLNKKPTTRTFVLTNIADFTNRKNALKQDIDASRQQANRRGKILKTYPLGEKFKNIYFTRREAECMVGLLRGNIINRVAMDLGLSPRKVEFYLKNMKNKIGCRTKLELIEIVKSSDFIKSVDFEH